MPTKIPQIERKRDDKDRTFAPKDFKKSSGTPTKIPQIVRKKDSLPKYNEKSNIKLLQKKNIFLMQIKYQVLKKMVLLTGQHLKN